MRDRIGQVAGNVQKRIPEVVLRDVVGRGHIDCMLEQLTGWSSSTVTDWRQQ